MTLKVNYKPRVCCYSPMEHTFTGEDAEECDKQKELFEEWWEEMYETPVFHAYYIEELTY